MKNSRQPEEAIWKRMSATLEKVLREIKGNRHQHHPGEGDPNECDDHLGRDFLKNVSDLFKSTLASMISSREKFQESIGNSMNDVRIAARNVSYSHLMMNGAENQVEKNRLMVDEMIQVLHEIRDALKNESESMMRRAKLDSD